MKVRVKTKEKVKAMAKVKVNEKVEISPLPIEDVLPQYTCNLVDLVHIHTDPWLSQGESWSTYCFMHFC